MSWLLVLTIIVTVMLAIEGIGAERNFRRSVEPPAPRGWEQAVLDALLLGRPR